jgi:uncharacterized protein YecE (DUF72 family)
MARLRIGTCSWKFPSWHGLVYSAPDGISYLEEYARHYDTVEIDQWFWSLFPPDSVRLPRPADVADYRRAVPADFRFTIKAPNSITLTHFYRKGKDSPLVPNPYFFSPTLFSAFWELIEPLHDGLGPLMFQFEYLNRQKMPSQDEFLRRLDAFVGQLPVDIPYAVETRNPNYLDEAYFRLLNRHHLIPVFLQGYYMPPLVQVYARWRAFILELGTVVVRLHGPEREEMEERTGKQWDQRVAPRDEELAGVVQMVQDLLGQGLDVYLNVNNHYEGSAPLTIQRVRELLGIP